MDEGLLIEVKVIVGTSVVTWGAGTGRGTMCRRTSWQRATVAHVLATLSAPRVTAGKSGTTLPELG